MSYHAGIWMWWGYYSDTWEWQVIILEHGKGRVVMLAQDITLSGAVIKLVHKSDGVIMLAQIITLAVVGLLCWHGFSTESNYAGIVCNATASNKGCMEFRAY